MTLAFRYIHVPRSDGTLRHAPYLPISVRTKEGKLLTLTALLDSGADEAVIPYDLAIILGFKADDEELSTGGIGGSVRVRKTTLEFTIGKGRETHHLRVPALIMQDKDADIPLILGRHGFFEHFQITFKQDEEKIVLKKVEPKHLY